jgi:hypothetical protein
MHPLTPVAPARLLRVETPKKSRDATAIARGELCGDAAKPEQEPERESL